ncbi:MAG: glycerophosphodiester phosphodiesterase [Anaerolineae bacterium]|nr:glycerophosphodiester phosphodiesterase [Anaerolineae bacterium]
MTTLDHFYDNRPRPLIFGHRGASAYAPMNTLPAFTLAAEQGADGIELDVWLSKDGVPVILHNDTLDETTDGSGYVWNMTLADLKQLDAGSWKDARFAGTRIPTLDEVFEAVGQRLLINVEIKSAEGMIADVEAAVAECIARHAMHDRVLISSFDPRVLARFAQINADVPIAFLEFEGTPPQAYVVADLMLNQRARHPHHPMIDAGYMERAHGKDWRVNAWTVDDVEVAKQLVALGVDGIITNVPDVMIAALRG